MTSANWERTFAKNKPEVPELVKKLNTCGYIFDEDTFITRCMINEAFENLKKHFLENGYQGGNLRVTGNYFPGAGSVFIIYDETKITYKESLVKLEDFYQNSVS